MQRDAPLVLIAGSHFLFCAICYTHPESRKAYFALLFFSDLKAGIIEVAIIQYFDVITNTTPDEIVYCQAI